MTMLKQENGHTLIELVVVIGLIGMVMSFIMNTFLSVNRTYLRADKKAQNLEEARIIINHITDNFHSYGLREIRILDQSHPSRSVPLEEAWEGLFDSNGFATVEKIVFFEDIAKKTEDFRVVYEETAVPGEGTLRWKKRSNNEIASGISSFKVRPSSELLEFKIEMIKKGHGIVADQVLEVGTTVNLKYMVQD